MAPSKTGYARGTQVSTSLTNRETFGGNSKAGLGRHIGMNQWTYGAIVNGSSGHPAPSASGPFYLAVNGRPYPISTTNQLSRVGVKATHGMFGPSADGVNTKQRETDQEFVDKNITGKTGGFPIQTVIDCNQFCGGSLREYLIWWRGKYPNGDLVIFGDSTLDNGNYQILFGDQDGTQYGMPKSVYTNGRYNNGFSKIDIIASWLDKSLPVASEKGGLNYAVGGATVSDRVIAPFNIPKLSVQIDQHLSKPNPISPNDLYFIKMGDNDINGFITTQFIGFAVQTRLATGSEPTADQYITFIEQNAPSFLDSIATEVVNQINRLINAGVKPQNIIALDIGIKTADLSTFLMSKGLLQYNLVLNPVDVQKVTRFSPITAIGGDPNGQANYDKLIAIAERILDNYDLKSKLPSGVQFLPVVDRNTFNSYGDKTTDWWNPGTGEQIVSSVIDGVLPPKNYTDAPIRYNNNTNGLYYDYGHVKSFAYQREILDIIGESPFNPVFNKTKYYP
jgi:phospholipase/lecithinase/hemolysin